MSKMTASAKHFFLTGNIQIGKSTILKAVIDENPDLKVSGIFTRWVNKSNAIRAGLYLFPADRKTIQTVWDSSFPDNLPKDSEKTAFLLSANNLIAAFDSGNYKKKIVNKQVFDILGKQYLKKAKNADLILIDEIGILEDKSYAFQDEVVKLLNGDIPVIGVVRNKPGVLTDIVRAHPSVKVIEITRQNREEIKIQMCNDIRQMTAKSSAK